MMVNIRGLIKKPNKIVAKPNLSAASNRTRPVAKVNVKQESSPKNNNNNHHKNNHINGTNGYHNNNNINGKRKVDKSERYVQGSILFEAPRKEPTVNVKPTIKREPNLISSEVIPRNKHIKRESNEIITTESLHNIEASSDEDELVDPEFLYKHIAERDDNDENMTPLLWDLYDGSLKKEEDIKTSEFTEVKSKPVIKKEPGTEDDDIDVDYDQKPDIDRGTFSGHNNEDLILLQMPQILLNRKDEKFGKLRVYKSGKLELLDTKNGIVYDVQRVYSQDDAPGHLKTFNNDESKCNLQKNNIYAKNNSMRRDAVVFSDRELVCLGSIENTDVLLVGPKVEQFMHII